MVYEIKIENSEVRSLAQFCRFVKYGYEFPEENKNRWVALALPPEEYDYTGPRHIYHGFSPLDSQLKFRSKMMDIVAISCVRSAKAFKDVISQAIAEPSSFSFHFRFASNYALNGGGLNFGAIQEYLARNPNTSEQGVHEATTISDSFFRGVELSYCAYSHTRLLADAIKTTCNKYSITNPVRILSRPPIEREPGQSLFAYWSEKSQNKKIRKAAFENLTETTKRFAYAKNALTTIEAAAIAEAVDDCDEIKELKQALKSLIYYTRLGIDEERIHVKLESAERDQSKVIDCLQLHEQAVRAILKSLNLWWWQIDRIVDNLRGVKMTDPPTEGGGDRTPRPAKTITEDVTRAITQGFMNGERAQAVLHLFENLGLLNTLERNAEDNK